MKKEEFDSKMTQMLEKIGSDSSNLILDDVAVLLSDNENMNVEIDKRNQEIADLKKRNETLQRVNGNLLLQVGMGTKDDTTENVINKKVAENKPDFNMRSCFDKNRKLQKERKRQLRRYQAIPPTQLRQKPRIKSSGKKLQKSSRRRRFQQQFPQ